MTQEPKITAALIYDFDGTLAPGNMQEYDFIPAVGQSNREFWNDANSLAEEQDADMTLTYMAKMLEAARSRAVHDHLGRARQPDVRHRRGRDHHGHPAQLHEGRRGAAAQIRRIF